MSALAAPPRPAPDREGLAPPLARADLLRSLGILVEAPAPGHAAIAAALGLPGTPGPGDHADVFLFATYPYASVYLGAEGMLGGEARDRIAGFWRAVGLTPPAEPDHLTVLLAMYAALLEREVAAPTESQRIAARHARGAFLWEHLVSWLPAWLAKVEELAPPYHAAWAGVLREALDGEAAETGEPAVLPLALRAAPALPDDAAPAADWIAALLAPVRSGVILTRWDLRRAGIELGLGSRAGERAFMLRSLLEQDPTGVSDWLTTEAARAADDHAERATRHGPVAEFWRQRAEACRAALLRVRPGQGKVEPNDGD